MDSDFVCSQRKEMIRDVLEKDTERLVEIYSYYVKETAVSFEYDVPSIDEFINRIKTVTKKYPYLVYEEFPSYCSSQ